MKFETLPGFRAFYPETCAERNLIFETWRRVLNRFCFHEYDPPVLEALSLYSEKSGDEIVNQLFAFEDKGGRAVAMRPEITPSLARMVGERAATMKRPIKWFNIGECFRYERPQKGRLRSFYQLNVDTLGEENALFDAELVIILIEVLREFGLNSSQFYVRLSDRTTWMHYLKAIGLSTQEDCLKVLSIIDKQERQSEQQTLSQLQAFLSSNVVDFWNSIQGLLGCRSMDSLKNLVDHLDTSGSHSAIDALRERVAAFSALLDALSAAGLQDYIEVDFGIVRGLAYYTGFVYEAFERKGKSRALAGGGRYDELVEKLGGPALPAAGFAMGDVTLLEILHECKCIPDLLIPHIQIQFIPFSLEGAPQRLLPLALELRRKGWRVACDFKSQSPSKQIKGAIQAGVTHLIVETEQGDFEVRNTEKRQSDTVSKESLIDHLNLNQSC